MKKLDRILDLYETGAFIFLLSLMTVVVFAQVICRYIIHSSIPWSEELSRYCMLFTVYIGVGAGLKAGTHTGVDAFVQALPAEAKKIVILIEKILVLGLSIAFFVISVQMTMQNFATGQKSATLFIPIAYAYAAIPLGFAGGIIRSLQNLLIFLKEGLMKKTDSVTDGKETK